MRPSDEGNAAPAERPGGATQHAAVQHSAVQHSAVQHSAVQHSAVQHSAVQHSEVQHTAIRHSPRGATQASRKRSRKRHSAPRGGQLPYMIVICGLVVALLWMRLSGQNARGGTLAVAGVVLAAAVARLILPERRAGMLVTRSRLADVVILSALGGGMLAAGLVVHAQS